MCNRFVPGRTIELVHVPQSLFSRVLGLGFVFLGLIHLVEKTENVLLG